MFKSTVNVEITSNIQTTILIHPSFILMISIIRIEYEKISNAFCCYIFVSITGICFAKILFK